MSFTAKLSVKIAGPVRFFADKMALAWGKMLYNIFASQGGWI